MADHLNNHEINAVVSALEGWEDRLTWDALVLHCASFLGRKPARQTLARSNRVKIAFNNAKMRLRGATADGGPAIPTSMKAAQDRIRRLEDRNRNLEKMTDGYKEMFVRWQYNAFRKNISMDDLNKALPTVDLSPTKIRSSPK